MDGYVHKVKQDRTAMQVSIHSIASTPKEIPENCAAFSLLKSHSSRCVSASFPRSLPFRGLQSPQAFFYVTNAFSFKLRFCRQIRDSKVLQILPLILQQILILHQKLELQCDPPFIISCLLALHYGASIASVAAPSNHKSELCGV